MEASTSYSPNEVQQLKLINLILSSSLIPTAIVIILLNSSLAYVILNKLTIRNSEIKLISVLCVVELFIGVDILILSLCKLIFGYEFFINAKSLQCQVFGFTMQAPTRVAMVINALLAILRYLAICHKREKSTPVWFALFAMFTIPAVCLFLASSILWDAKPTSSLCQCHGYLSPTITSKIALGIITLYYLIPCWLTTICYLLIGKKINQNLNLSFQQIEKKQLQKQKLCLILQLILVTIVYNLDFMLSYLTMLLNLIFNYKRLPVVDMFVILTKHFSIMLNPLIIISFQPNIHHEYLCIIVKFNAKFKANLNRVFRCKSHS
jgi:hypothetical protein